MVGQRLRMKRISFRLHFFFFIFSFILFASWRTLNHDGDGGGDDDYNGITFQFTQLRKCPSVRLCCPHKQFKYVRCAHAQTAHTVVPMNRWLWICGLVCNCHYTTKLCVYCGNACGCQQTENNKMKSLHCRWRRQSDRGEHITCSIQFRIVSLTYTTSQSMRINWIHFRRFRSYRPAVFCVNE